MKNILIIAGLLLPASTFSGAPEGSALPFMKGKRVNIEVIVTDINNKAIEGALIVNGREGEKPTHKFTDQQGRARFAGVGQGYFNPEILKSGYYLHKGCFVMKINDPGVEREYRVVLKPVLDQVPIERAVVARKYYPLEWEESGGFDLEKLDFVAPHGNGSVTDLVFKTTWERVEQEGPGHSVLRITTILSVKGKEDALFPFNAPIVGSISEPGSLLMPPNVFPRHGGVRSIEYTATYHENGGWTPPINREAHLAFRVRTRLDEGGNIESSHVGWLQAPIEASPFLVTGPERKPYSGRWKEVAPEWGYLDFTRHWNPNPKSTSLEPKGMRWENSLPEYIETYHLQNLPGIESLKRLPPDHPEFQPTRKEREEEIRRKFAERKKERERLREEEKKSQAAP